MDGKLSSAAATGLTAVLALLAPIVVPAIALVFLATWLADLRQTGRLPTRIDETGDC